MKIIDIQALQILDSRGNPTMQVEVLLEDGSKGSFRDPSGASTGIHEAHELRDGIEGKFHGKSVEQAVTNVHKIKSHFFDEEYTQEEFDTKLIHLDGTENKESLGANAMLGMSIAFAKAQAKSHSLSTFEYLYRVQNSLSLNKQHKLNLPEVHLFANVINGGLHAGNKLNIQEFMLVPLTGDVKTEVQMISEIYQTLKELIGEKYGKAQTAVGDEGGFAPDIAKPTDALDLLISAIEKTGYIGKVGLALDTAASDFMKKESNKYEVEEGVELDYKELTKYYNNLIEKYPILSIEDPFGEDDFDAWNYFKKNVTKCQIQNPLNNSNDILIVGDDILVTNPKRIETATKKKICNALLLKINQIGTLTESLQAHTMAKEAGWHTIVSHRSGETIDDFIADLCVALESSIKIGAPARGERVAKYNRLLNIYR